MITMLYVIGNLCGYDDKGNDPCIEQISLYPSQNAKVTDLIKTKRPNERYAFTFVRNPIER